MHGNAWNGTAGLKDLSPKAQSPGTVPVIFVLPLRFRKAGRVRVVAHERLTEPHVTMK